VLGEGRQNLTLPDSGWSLPYGRVGWGPCPCSPVLWRHTAVEGRGDYLPQWRARRYPGGHRVQLCIPVALKHQLKYV